MTAPVTAVLTVRQHVPSLVVQALAASLDEEVQACLAGTRHGAHAVQEIKLDVAVMQAQQLTLLALARDARPTLAKVCRLLGCSTMTGHSCAPSRCCSTRPMRPWTSVADTAARRR